MQQGIMSKLDALRQNMGQGQGQPAPAGPSPMAGPAPMGPAPMGPAPMGPESMGPESMGPELMQDQAPEMLAEAEQPAPVDAGEDAQKLASAVLQRSQGNPQLALDIIEGAKGVVMQTIQGSERPRMMSMGGATGQALSDKDMELIKELLESRGQTGRGMSDKDLETLQNIAGMENGGATDNLPNEGLKALAESGEKGKKAVESMGFMAEGGSLNELMKQRYG